MYSACVVLLLCHHIAAAVGHQFGILHGPHVRFVLAVPGGFHVHLGQDFVVVDGGGTVVPVVVAEQPAAFLPLPLLLAPEGPLGAAPVRSPPPAPRVRHGLPHRDPPHRPDQVAPDGRVLLPAVPDVAPHLLQKAAIAAVEDAGTDLIPIRIEPNPLRLLLPKL
jgi:hypothetical protein